MQELNPQLQSQVFDSLILHMRAERGKARARARGLGWHALAADLIRLGVRKTTADALVSWADSQTEQSRQSPLRVRMLHPMEREFISVAAYDYLLELYRLGLLGALQVEQILEGCAYLTALPATRDQVQKMVLRFFSENVDSQGLGTSH